jgi:hypothetical protein
MGTLLFSTFLRAELPTAEMTAVTPIACGPGIGGYGYVVAVLRSLLPSIERTGIATPAEIDIETLVARMRARQTYCAFDQHSTH